MTDSEDSGAADRPDKRSVLMLSPRVDDKSFAPRPRTGPSASDNKARRHGKLFLFFGVILPLLTVVFEITTRFCAQNYFDPFPSNFHVALFCLIPLSNFLIWLSSRRDLSNFYGPMSLLSGMAMGIGCLYSLMFLPITAGSALYVLTFGFGLLGLAPLLSVPCSWLAGKAVCQMAHCRRTYFNAHQVEHIGHLIILVMVIAIELPSTLTRVHIADAASSNTLEERASNIDWLRKYGSEEVMLRACLERAGKATDIMGTLYESAHPIPVEKARQVFYQVTGKAYNSVAIPASFRATVKHNGTMPESDPLNSGVSDQFDIDSDIAGSTVSGMARGLSQSASQFSGKVDGQSVCASIKWTLSFQNSSTYDREARARIQLPPGAVISRATMTINGVERVAEIKSRQKARALYQAAVVERKNPLLISYTGRDQILAQCFPIEPGKTVEISLSMAIPMYLDKGTSAVCVLPYLTERNFVIDKKSKIETDFKVAGNEHGDYTVDVDSTGREYLRLSRDTSITTATVPAPAVLGGGSITRHIGRPVYPHLDNLVVLVDGSAFMQPYLGEIADTLAASADKSKMQIIYVGDTAQKLTDPAMLKSMKAQGGQDDRAELTTALQGIIPLRHKSHGAVLWIHGAQPVVTADLGYLQSLIGQAEQPMLYDMQLTSGPNETLNSLASERGLREIIRTGSIGDDLGYFIDSTQAVNHTQSAQEYAVSGTAAWLDSISKSPSGSAIPAPPVCIARVPMPAGKTALQSTTPTDVTYTDNVKDDEIEKALVNIWCASLVDNLLGGHDGFSTLKASEIANSQQIVTPISSAIIYCPDDYRPPKVVTPASVTIKQWIGSLQAAILTPLRIFDSGRVAYKKASETVAFQLNNLSCAAGSSSGAGAPAVDSLNIQDLKQKTLSMPARSTNQPESKNIGGTADSAKLDAIEHDYRQMAKENMGNQAYGSGNVITEGGKSLATYPQPQAAPGQAKDEVANQKPQFASQSVVSEERQQSPKAPGDSEHYNYKNIDMSRDTQSLRLKYPVLQGATSGTVAPQDVAPEKVQIADGFDKGGLSGAPVDPRYGQSNEVSPGFYGEDVIGDKVAKLMQQQIGPLTGAEFATLAFVTLMALILFAVTDGVFRPLVEPILWSGRGKRKG